LNGGVLLDRQHAQLPAHVLAEIADDRLLAFARLGLGAGRRRRAGGRSGGRWCSLGNGAGCTAGLILVRLWATAMRGSMGCDPAGQQIFPIC
jgi:hypothetical protein